MRIVQQEREVFRGLVSQPAATGLFPGQPLIKNTYSVSRTRELFPAHGARRSATDDDNLSHLCVLGELCSRLRRRRDGSNQLGGWRLLGQRKEHQAKTR